MLSKLFGFFGKKKKEEQEEQISKPKIDGIVLPEEIDDSSEKFDLADFPDPVIEGNVDSKNSFLIVDDLEATFFLYETDFDDIKSRVGIDIREEFKIVKCSGDDAGFIAQKYIANNNDELVLAILDITLGKIIKLADGTIVTCDGIDIGIQIMSKYPNCDVRFCSAHRLSRENAEIKKYIDKFEHTTGLDIEDYYFSKKSNRTEFILDMYYRHTKTQISK